MNQKQKDELSNSELNKLSVKMIEEGKLKDLKQMLNELTREQLYLFGKPNSE